MSPEERAKAIYEAEKQWSDYSPADGIQTNEFKFVPFVASAIRAAENGALERAAEFLTAKKLAKSGLAYRTLSFVVRDIRALKHPE